MEQVPTYLLNQDPEIWDGTFVDNAELQGDDMGSRDMYNLTRQMGRIATAMKDMEDIANGNIQSLVERRARREIRKAMNRTLRKSMGYKVRVNMINPEGR